LSRTEITELSDRLRCLLDTSPDDMIVTTAMKNRVQGAVVALDAIAGRDPLANDVLRE
jgi:hypothetical protein